MYFTVLLRMSVFSCFFHVHVYIHVCVFVCIYIVRIHEMYMFIACCHVKCRFIVVVCIRYTPEFQWQGIYLYLNSVQDTAQVMTSCHQLQSQSNSSGRLKHDHAEIMC